MLTNSTSAKEVMFSSAFVCLLAGLGKITQPISTEFGGNVAHGPRKKALDFGDNMIVGFRTGFVLQLGGCTAILRMARGCDCVTGRLSNSNNFARSIALAAARF